MTELAEDVRSLTDFKRNTGDHLRRLKETGRPLALTVDGRVELVVQDAESYQRTLELLDRAEAIQGISEGLEDVRQGRTQPAREAFEELRRKYDIPADA